MRRKVYDICDVFDNRDLLIYENALMQEGMPIDQAKNQGKIMFDRFYANKEKYITLLNDISNDKATVPAVNDLFMAPESQVMHKWRGMALLVSAQYNNTLMATYFINMTANVDAIRDEDKHSALMHVCYNNNLFLCQHLIENGAKVTATDKDKNTSLMIACQQGHSDIASYLIEQQSDVNGVNNLMQTPLMIACQHKHLYTVKMLLDMGADIDFKTNISMPALTTAVKLNWAEGVELLLAHQAKIDTVDYNGNTPLYYAKKYDNQQIINLLTRPNLVAHHAKKVYDKNTSKQKEI